MTPRRVAWHRCATADLTPLVAPGGDLVGMHSADAGRYITFGGGVPLWSMNRVVGGVGVSGGSVAEDVEAANAAQTVFVNVEASS